MYEACTRVCTQRRCHRSEVRILNAMLLDQVDSYDSRRWACDAVRLHDVEFGAGICMDRMEAFMQAQGWEDVIKIIVDSGMS